MQKVPRKTGKKDNKKSLMLLIAFGFLLLCAGMYFLLQAPEELPPPESARETWITSMDADEIQRLSLSLRGSASYTLVNTEGTVCLEGQTDMDVRQDVAAEMLEAAGYLKAVDEIGAMSELQADPADFGLTEPALSVKITGTDNREQDIFFGNAVPETEEAMYYCLSGENLYTVLAAPCDVLFHDAVYLRSFRQPQLQSDLIDRIEVTGEKEITFRYTPVGFVMEKPFSYPADKQKMSALLTRLDQMAFEAYLGEKNEVDLDSLGLAAPSLTVKLTQAESVIDGITAEGETVSIPVAEKNYILEIGREDGQSGMYVCWENGVYKASRFLLGMWKDMQPEEFFSTTPMDFQVEQLTGVEIRHSGIVTGYRLDMVEALTENNEIATDEYGNVLWDVRVKKDETDIDAQAFLEWYVQLNRMPLSGRVKEGWQKEGDALYEITVETPVLTREIAFYPYDALHAVMTVDGTGLFYLEKTALSVLENLP